MITPQQFNLIAAKRTAALKQDSAEYQAKANKLLNWLSTITPYCEDLKVLEMHPQQADDPIKSNIEVYNYFNRWHNTRTKLLHETRAEIDKLEAIKAEKIIIHICSNLIEQGFHFAVFHALGQRSAHIIIYDFFELCELTPFQREKAQAQFWQKVAGFYFCYLDKGVWQDEHFVPLEFRPHWKYGTIFDLIIEYAPENKNIISEQEQPKPKKVFNRVIKAKPKPKCEVHGEGNMYLSVSGYKCNSCQMETWRQDNAALRN